MLLIASNTRQAIEVENSTERFTPYMLAVYRGKVALGEKIEQLRLGSRAYRNVDGLTLADIAR